MSKKIDHWKTIEEIGWGRKSTDYNALSREWFAKLGKDGMKALACFVEARLADLHNAIEDYEEKNSQLDCGSDDSFSDVTYHVVGMGFVEWQKAMKNPKLVERRYIAKYGSFDGYKESFAYVFHEPEPERTEEDKQAEIRNLVKHAEALQKEIDGLAAAVDNVRNQADTLLRISHLIEKDMSK